MHGPEDRQDQELHDVRMVRQELDEIREQTRRSQWDVWFTVAGRALALVAPFVLAGAVAWFGAVSRTVTDTQQRVRLLEDTRFSSRDGAQLRAELIDTFATRFPPPWLTESIDRIETATTRVGDRIQALEQRLAALEGKLQQVRDR